MKNKNRLVIITFLFTVMTVVNIYAFIPSQVYTKDMRNKVNEHILNLGEKFNKSLKLEIIGYSSKENIPIYAVTLGKGKHSILINGGHHARESMTTLLVLNQLNYLVEQYNWDMTTRRLLDTISITFVPMINPDGLHIAMSGKDPTWKSNGRGVDLNRNYDTPLAKSRLAKKAGNNGYSPYPFSENETVALKNLCEQRNFETAIAYHSAGEILYWWWYQTGECLEYSQELMKTIVNYTGYRPVPKSGSLGGRGFTDWFIQEFNKPGFTPEIGTTVNGKPLPLWEYNKIWKSNKDVPIALIKKSVDKNMKIVKDSAVPTIKIFDDSLVGLSAYLKTQAITTDYNPETKEVSIGNYKFKEGTMLEGMNVPVMIYKGAMYIDKVFIEKVVTEMKQALEPIPVPDIDITTSSMIKIRN